MAPPEVPELDYLEYVETALAVMESFYYSTDRVDWERVRDAALGGVSADPAAGEAYTAIGRALFELADPHSYFLPPRDESTEKLPFTLPSGERIGDVGYLNLPGVTNLGIDPERPAQYADTVNDLLVELDGPEPACGWVVDLRDNGGGTIGPMFASLGPLLGRGVVLTATGPTAFQTITVAEDLSVVHDTEARKQGADIDSPLVTEFTLGTFTPEETVGFIEAASTPTEPVHPPTLPDPPVAVLISGGTASAGEWVAIAFQGREHTRTFGETTAGVSTGIGAVQFTDGGVLAIATVAPADRLGRIYDTNVFPDQVIGYSLPDEDGPLDRALEWLAGQDACA